MTINIGIEQTERKALVKALSHVLADTYTLYLQTHTFHWNVKGFHFQSLHLMFESQYTELAQAIDELAERIRALGEDVPGTYGEIAEFASVHEVRGPLTETQMLTILTQNHETLIRTARQFLPIFEAVRDTPSADLVTARIATHEKTAWMLRSHLAE